MTFIMPQIAKADSYKFSHWKQYPPKTELVSSYIEARGVSAPFNTGNYVWDKTVFFGAQYYAKTYLTQRVVTEKSLDRFKGRINAHGEPFNYEGFKYILEKHDGYMPIRVQALPEGSVVPLSTPLMQVVNTDPVINWGTSFTESNLLRIWYPTTVATLSFMIKRIIRDSMLRTCGHTNGLEFKLHDFGPRGASSGESAMIGGMAHLCSFNGTDNVEALEGADHFYGEEMAGYSVPAAEHSTMTSWGGEPGEIEVMKHLINEFGTGIFSVVSDSYDIYTAVGKKFGGELKEMVRELEGRGGKLVVRPDSGDPTTVPVEIVKMLMGKFGVTYNGKAFAQLPPYLGVLQGDGINQHSIEQILQNLENENIATDSVVFGMGGALLQQVNRDTLKFAMKASAAKVDGHWRDVFKDPIGDTGKRSKKGRLAVIKVAGAYSTIPEELLNSDGYYMETYKNQLEDLVVNGKLVRKTTLADIRKRVNEAL